MTPTRYICDTVDIGNIFFVIFVIYELKCSRIGREKKHDLLKNLEFAVPAFFPSSFIRIKK